MSIQAQVNLGILYIIIKYCHIDFLMVKVETLDFPGSSVACYRKVCRFRQRIELLKLCECSKKCHVLHQGENSYGVSLGREIKVCINGPDQMAKIARMSINGKIFFS